MTVQSERVAHKDLVNSGRTILHKHFFWHGVFYGNYGDCDPIALCYLWNMNAVSGPTPTNIGTTIARCVQFTPPVNTIIWRVRMFGVGATSGLYAIAIYPVGTGSSKLWEVSSINSAVNTWMIYQGTPSPIILVGGTKYWFCIRALGTGTTAGFKSMHAPLGTNFWGADKFCYPSFWDPATKPLSVPVFCQFTTSAGGPPTLFPDLLPVVAAAAYAGGATGSVPFAFLDTVI